MICGGFFSRSVRTFAINPQLLAAGCEYAVRQTQDFKNYFACVLPHVVRHAYPLSVARPALANRAIGKSRVTAYVTLFNALRNATEKRGLQ